MDLNLFQNIHLNGAELTFVHANPLMIKFMVQGYEVTIIEFNGIAVAQSVVFGATQYTDPNYLVGWKSWIELVYNAIKPRIQSYLTPTPTLNPTPTLTITPTPVSFLTSNRKEQLAYVNTMTGEEFEVFVAGLFKQLGYETTLTQTSGDYGADLILERDFLKIVVQLKRLSSSPVSLKAVQEALGAKYYYNADSAWVITNSSFTKSAIELAEKSNVRLFDKNKLFTLMANE